MEFLDEFRHQLSVLRGGILEYARSPSAVFPSLQFFGDFKREDARLTAEISAARDRISKAPGRVMPTFPLANGLMPQRPNTKRL